jgi:hypothetical protein
MFSILTLINYLQTRNPYPCLNILESTLVFSQRNRFACLPAPFLEDLVSLFDKETIEAEIKNLEEMAILMRTDEGISLNGEAQSSVTVQLNQLKKSMELTLDKHEQTAGIFLNELVAYLKQEISCLDVSEAVDDVEYLLTWKGSRYRLQLAFSPAWLPAVAEESSAENTFFAVIGPFAAQNWQKMLQYYEYPEFRNFTAYFDPWHHQKMNISKGGLFAYFDRFFRDCYGLKFFIPGEFPRKLQSLGLLRYNDEK